MQPTHQQQQYLIQYTIRQVAAFIALHWFSPLILPATVNDNASVVKVDKKIDNFEQKTATTSRTADWGYQSKRFWFLLVCLALVCAQMNSIVPSIQSFSVMPYSLLTYHLALSLSNLAQPLACFLPFWLTPKSTRMVASLTGLSSVLCLWILVLAVQSPTPWLYYSFWGGFMAIGSFSGSIIMFPLVNLLHIFESASACHLCDLNADSASFCKA
uniref:Riboflavin transporter n=1 Tax=Ditylenchus dipsaci TaxID=166011 RepID=A0A915DSX7_9BILA